MNTQEHFLACVAEEAVEIAEIALRISHAANKALRFGLDEKDPAIVITNRTDLVRETNDLLGALEGLHAVGVELPGLYQREAIEMKKAKIEKWMKHAESIGTLQR